MYCFCLNAQNFTSEAEFAVGSEFYALNNKNVNSVYGRVLWIIEEKFLVGGLYHVSTRAIEYQDYKVNEYNSGGIIFGYRYIINNSIHLSGFMSFEGGGPQIQFSSGIVEPNLLINRYQIEFLYTFFRKCFVSGVLSKNVCSDLSSNSVFKRNDFSGISVMIGAGIRL